VRVPEGLSSVEAAPLLCADLTMYKALTRIGAHPGALVAVQGIGGLGHLALQYAGRIGCRLAAVARGTGEAEPAAELGADHYIDSSSDDPGAALRDLGGAGAIIATAACGASPSALFRGLAPDGHMVAVAAAADPVV
jgi:alcohol dehydrogenase, propanol-preferring